LTEFHRPRGVPQIEVTFDTDANGILHVSAGYGLGRNKNFHHRQLRMPRRSGEDAARSRRTPKRTRRRRKAIEIKNNADMLAYQSESS
jgi:molecular chaperone DnaK